VFFSIRSFFNSIQDARKFARHSYRSTLVADDVNSALRLRNMEGLLGYAGSDASAFHRVVVASASASSSSASSSAASSSSSSSDDLFFLDDRSISLDAYLAQPLLPSSSGRTASSSSSSSSSSASASAPAPSEPNFSVHWLAIEGVQPRIPQNPLPTIGMFAPRCHVRVCVLFMADSIAPTATD
jgi:transcription initiation factor TFIID subunit 6